MQTLCILSKDEIFANATKAELCGYAIAVEIWAGRGAVPLADTYLWDMDSFPTLPENISGQVICAAWNKEKPAEYSGVWLDRPFRPARLRAVLKLYGDESKEMGIYPVHSRRSVLLGGEEIKLTEGEFRLFCCLFENRGRYISREDLHKAVWQGEGDEGVVNVYVHYLRTKLEKNGQKLFHSARGKGYAYLDKGKGEMECSN